MTDKFDKETWTFRGYHYNGQKLITLWIDGNGNELIYGKDRTTEAIVGAKYEIEVNRDNGVRARFGSKRFLHDQPLSARAAEWRLDSRDAEAQDAGDKLHSKMLRENGNIGALTLDEVRDMMRKRRGYKNRQGMIAAILDYVES